MHGRDRCAQERLLNQRHDCKVSGGKTRTGDGVCIGTSFGDGGLRRIVGGIVVEVGDVADERIWVARIRHAHLLARHKLQATNKTPNFRVTPTLSQVSSSSLLHTRTRQDT